MNISGRRTAFITLYYYVTKIRLIDKCVLDFQSRELEKYIKRRNIS